METTILTGSAREEVQAGFKKHPLPVRLSGLLQEAVTALEMLPGTHEVVLNARFHEKNPGKSGGRVRCSAGGALIAQRTGYLPNTVEGKDLVAEDEARIAAVDGVFVMADWWTEWLRTRRAFHGLGWEPSATSEAYEAEIRNFGRRAERRLAELPTWWEWRNVEQAETAWWHRRAEQVAAALPRLTRIEDWLLDGKGRAVEKPDPWAKERADEHGKTLRELKSAAGTALALAGMERCSELVGGRPETLEPVDRTHVRETIAAAAKALQKLCFELEGRRTK